MSTIPTAETVETPPQVLAALQRLGNEQPLKHFQRISANVTDILMFLISEYLLAASCAFLLVELFVYVAFGLSWVMITVLNRPSKRVNMFAKWPAQSPGIASLASPVNNSGQLPPGLLLRRQGSNSSGNGYASLTPSMDRLGQPSSAASSANLPKPSRLLSRQGSSEQNLNEIVKVKHTGRINNAGTVPRPRMINCPSLMNHSYSDAGDLMFIMDGPKWFKFLICHLVANDVAPPMLSIASFFNFWMALTLDLIELARGSFRTLSVEAAARIIIRAPLHWQDAVFFFFVSRVVTGEGGALNGMAAFHSEVLPFLGGESRRVLREARAIAASPAVAASMQKKSGSPARKNAIKSRMKQPAGSWKRQSGIVRFIRNFVDRTLKLFLTRLTKGLRNPPAVEKPIARFSLPFSLVLSIDQSFMMNTQRRVCEHQQHLTYETDNLRRRDLYVLKRPDFDAFLHEVAQFCEVIFLSTVSPPGLNAVSEQFALTDYAVHILDLHQAPPFRTSAADFIVTHSRCTSANQALNAVCTFTDSGRVPRLLSIGSLPDQVAFPNCVILPGKSWFSTGVERFPDKFHIGKCSRHRVTDKALLRVLPLLYLLTTVQDFQNVLSVPSALGQI